MDRERDEQAADPAGAQGDQCRGHPETEQEGNQAESPVRFDHPFHGLHSGTNGEWCTESRLGGYGQAGQERAPDQHPGYE